jgi:anaerobic selenocysteine-containing dehydrogenase
MVSAVTGSLDRPQGMWFNPGYLSQTHHQTWEPRDGTPAAGPASRPELPGRFGELPCAAIVDEIEAGNIRALIILGGNRLIAWPQPERVTRALASLDVLAVVEVIENEMTALASHVLPAAGQLERADVPTGAEVYALRSFSQCTEAVLAPVAERRPTWWVLAQLGRRLGAKLPGDLNPDTATESAVLHAIYGGNRDGWQAIRDAPTAIVTPERPYGWVHDSLPDGRLRLAPKMLVRKMSSTLADGHGLARAASPEAILHPDDAAEMGITDGGRAVIRSAHGDVTMTVRIDGRTRRDTVSAPHGFTAANTARLISGDDVDALTGMPVMTGIPVTVAPSRGR